MCVFLLTDIQFENFWYSLTYFLDRFFFISSNIDKIHLKYIRYIFVRIILNLTYGNTYFFFTATLYVFHKYILTISYDLFYNHYVIYFFPKYNILPKSHTFPLGSNFYFTKVMCIIFLRLLYV